MKGVKKTQVLLSLLLILAIFVFTEIKAESHFIGKESIIEVCSEGVVYVPPGTKIVKCNGKVKKVRRITPYVLLEKVEESCLCPSCCGGECGIIVSCDMEPEMYTDTDVREPGTLCIMWLDCD